MSMESEQRKIEHVRKTPEAELRPEFSFASSSSSPSSSARSSLEVDIVSKNPFDDSIEESKTNGQPLHGQESISSLNSTQTPPWSLTSASPPQGIEEQLLLTTSPPIQTMGHPPGYDPNRIPSSVFSSNPTNASEWSVASNDSLFSIHVGNNSFSRDLLWRSGELSKLDELSNVEPSETKHNEMSNLHSSLPTVVEVSAHEESGVKSSNASHADNLGSNKSIKVAPETSKMTSTTSSSTARLSEESARSSSSFAFPVLVNDSGKMGSLKKVPEKTEEKTELQTEEPKATQKSSIGKWFSWLSCLPRCC